MSVNLSKFVVTRATFDFGPTEVVLGSGSLGKVGRAIDKRTNKEVAVKFLSKSLDTEEERRSFTREVEILARNTHPATLQLRGFCLEPEGPMIVTDLFKNGTLGDVLKEQYGNIAPPGWNPTKASICIFGIAAAMAHLHERGILHRDLKPDNVFLNDQFEPVVTDFAVSCASNETMCVGTPLYMAPELWGDEELYDRPIDVYAFAILLYSFFAEPNRLDDKVGTFRSASGMMMRIQNGARFVRPKDIPEVHWSLIQNAWQEEQTVRPTFREIVDVFHEHHLYILPGADRDQVLEYEERILKQTDHVDEHQAVLSILKAGRTAGSIYPLRMSQTGDLIASGGLMGSGGGGLMGSGGGGLMASGGGGLMGSGRGSGRTSRNSGAKKKGGFSWD
jgi:serine/threonine protein kinase